MNFFNKLKTNNTLLFIALFLSAFLSGAFLSGTLKNSKVSDISVPEGFQRIIYKKSGFPEWLRNLHLKSNSKILLYNNEEYSNNNFKIMFVINRKLLFKKNIEQCADFCMRFWGEYHRNTNQLNKLYLYDYFGKKVFYKSEAYSFEDFLKTAMLSSNPHSLKIGCKQININDAIPGDLIVQSKEKWIGHTSMIIDACENKKGEKLFLIGFGFSPAQEFHIEKAADNFGKKGWFSLSGYIEFLEQKYSTYGSPVIMQF